MMSVYFFLRMRSVVSVLPKKLTMTLYSYLAVRFPPVLLFIAVCMQPTCGGNQLRDMFGRLIYFGCKVRTIL